ncbi:protein LLP homolog [Ptiloglossa arizonensis]|uniref:protein LLP homolog n=1 Tax=Ptiloglossa arizonensis TaxID=3350558 RepID=UPI003F9F4B6D
MAKSIRSKWKRKCRAVKRERYGAKELKMLKKTLGIDNTSQDAEMMEISNIATVVDAMSIKENEKAKEDAKTDDVKKMDVESSGRVYNKRTMQDQYGNYPIWMSLRKIAKHKKGRAKSQKASAKSHKRLTRQQKRKAKRNQVLSKVDNVD